MNLINIQNIIMIWHIPLLHLTSLKDIKSNDKVFIKDILIVFTYITGDVHPSWIPDHYSWYFVMDVTSSTFNLPVDSWFLSLNLIISDHWLITLEISLISHQEKVKSFNVKIKLLRTTLNIDVLSQMKIQPVKSMCCWLWALLIAPPPPFMTFKTTISQK